MPAGSILDLRPDTEYEIALRLHDPDHGGAERTLRARTRAVPEDPPGARFRHVNSTNFRDMAARAEPALVPAAIEEFLRHCSPIQIFGRNAARDVTLHGITIPQGDTVALSFGSANRDDAVFPGPDRVILDRTPNRHFAFGSGPHTCLGAPVARLELELTLRDFVARVSGWRVAPGLEVAWKPRGDRHGLAALPVVIDPAVHRDRSGAPESSDRIPPNSPAA